MPLSSERRLDSTTEFRVTFHHNGNVKVGILSPPIDVVPVQDFLVGSFRVKTSMDHFSVMAMSGKVEVGGIFLVPEMLHRVRGYPEMFGFYCKMSQEQVMALMGGLSNLYLNCKTT